MASAATATWTRRCSAGPWPPSTAAAAAGDGPLPETGARQSSPDPEEGVNVKYDQDDQVSL
jgi:hypothetical protein